MLPLLLSAAQRMVVLFFTAFGWFLAVGSVIVALLHIGAVATSSLSLKTAGIPLSHTLSFYARSLTCVLVMGLSALVGISATPVLKLVGQSGLSQWAVGRMFFWLTGILTGVWFEVLEADETGEKNAHKWLNETRPAVFIGNHQSELDVLMLGAIFPKYCSVTAKRSLRNAPLLGQFMTLSKTIFIDRSNPTSAIAAFVSAAETMKVEKQSVYIFPEGTRSYTTEPEIRSFKKGAFRLAIQAGVPIVPVVVANYSSVFNVKKRIFRPGRVPVRVMRPVGAGEYGVERLDELIDRVHREMSGAMVEMEPIVRAWNDVLPEFPERRTAEGLGSAGKPTSTVGIASGVDRSGTGVEL